MLLLLLREHESTAEQFTERLHFARSTAGPSVGNNYQPVNWNALDIICHRTETASIQLRTCKSDFIRRIEKKRI
jgi:hypothetical protein